MSNCSDSFFPPLCYLSLASLVVKKYLFIWLPPKFLGRCHCKDKVYCRCDSRVIDVATVSNRFYQSRDRLLCVLNEMVR